jgi:hypothetical protein
MRHVSLTCSHHPDLRWSTKEIAVDSNGRYNGRRNLFFSGSTTVSHPASLPPEYFVRECTCSADALRFSPEEIERQKTEPLMGAAERQHALLMSEPDPFKFFTDSTIRE